MRVMCDCGKEMFLRLWEPDKVSVYVENEVYVELYCDKCGAEFKGKLKSGKEGKAL